MTQAVITVGMYGLGAFLSYSHMHAIAYIVDRRPGFLSTVVSTVFWPILAAAALLYLPFGYASRQKRSEG